MYNIEKTLAKERELVAENSHKSSPAFRITRTTGFPGMLKLLLLVITYRGKKEFIKIECYLQSNGREMINLLRQTNL